MDETRGERPDLDPPHGIYYVNRDATKSWFLAEETPPEMPAVERAVLGGLILLADQNSLFSMSRFSPTDKSPAKEIGSASNLLGMPHGIYYVPRTAPALYELTGELPPDISRIEAATANGLLDHVADWLRRERNRLT